MKALYLTARYLLLLAYIFTVSAQAAEIKILGATHGLVLTPAKIRSLVEENFDVNSFREVRVQVSGRDLVVFLFSKKYHKFETAKLSVSHQGDLLSVEDNFQPRAGDLTFVPKCPDESVQFIAFCPNDIDVEQEVTKDVAAFARQKGLKTVELLLKDATKEAYLNYMVCPNLVGNFYDGDSDPHSFITYDSTISHQEISALLPKSFRYKVTNIWLACQAYNDPILSSVLVDAQAQKYAAGINNLLVGPSDYTAACTMKAGIEGKPLSSSFNSCYERFDTPEDKWGFGGQGADIFGE